MDTQQNKNPHHQFDTIGLDTGLEDNFDSSQPRFNDVNLVIQSSPSTTTNCDTTNCTIEDVDQGELSTISMHEMDDPEEEYFQTPSSTIHTAKPISSTSSGKSPEDFPVCRSYNTLDQTVDPSTPQSVPVQNPTRGWLWRWISSKYSLRGNLNDGEFNTIDGPCIQPSSSTPTKSVPSRIQWSRNYLEAAIYLEEGYNNDKFDYHPQAWSELPAYMLVHNRFYHWIDLIACLLILALALFEKPALDGIRLPESIHASMELFGLFIISLMLSLKYYWFGYRYFTRHWRTAIKTLVLCLMVVEAIVVLVRQDSHIRITRSLRPVFLIDNHFLGGVRRLIRQTIQSLRSFLDMLILLLFFMIFFAISGFYLMSDIENNEYFVSIWNSFLSLFVLLTTSNFPDVMMPAYRQNQLYALFFIVFLMINLYFFLNIILAVVYLAFSSIEKEKFRKLYVHRRRACGLAFRLLISDNSDNDDTPPRNIELRHFTGMLRCLRPNLSELELFLMYKALINCDNQELSSNSTISPSSFDSPPRYNNFDNVQQQLTLDRFYRIYEVLNLQWKMCGESIPWFAKLRCDFVRITLYKLRSIIIHRFFGYFVYLIIICAAIYQLLNALFGGYENWQQQIGLSTSAAAICALFISLYTAEMLMKLLALGPGEYFRVGWNCFDALITTIALVSLILSQYLHLLSVSTSLFSLRSLRLLDLLRAKVTRYRDILGPFAFVIIRRFISVTVVVLIVYYFFAIIAMECFAGFKLMDCCNGTNVEVYFRSNGTENYYYYLNNFDDIITSYITLFELMVVNNWQVLMTGYILVTGTRWTSLFFIVFYIISLVVMTIVIAFILDTFQFHVQYRNRFGDKNLSVKITSQVCISKADFDRLVARPLFPDNSVTIGGCWPRLRSIFGCFVGGFQRFNRLDSIRSVPEPASNNLDATLTFDQILSGSLSVNDSCHSHYHHHRADCHLAHRNSLHPSMPPSGSSPCLPYYGTKIRDKFSYNQQMYSDEIQHWIQHNNE